MASRKKSIASQGPATPAPQLTLSGGNTLAAKAADTVPLYKQCTYINRKLTHIYGFEPYIALGSSAATYFAEQAANAAAAAQAAADSDAGNTPAPPQAASRRSVDPVQGLWDTLALGVPLVFLFNLLDIPAGSRLDVNCDPAEFNIRDIKAAKRATAAFVVGLHGLKASDKNVPEGEPKPWAGIELFTVGDLINEPRNTNGFVKVVATLRVILDRLPEHVYMEGHNVEETEDAALDVRAKICKELIDTERAFVRDLEVMQSYAENLRQNNIVSPDTVHNLLLNVNELLDAQRRFLISMEGVVDNKWPNQRWGSIWTANEDLFVVYEPFCANFVSASELLVEQTENLMAVKHIIHPRSELPAFLIKPIQRITKYPLLLEELKKRVTPEEYPHYEDLLLGIASAKRIADRINEAERKSQNAVTCRALEKRVVDWKGHHISGFGPLKLDDLFTVNKSEVDRDYHVFLFERIILCCKEAVGGEGGDRNSIGSRKGAKGAKKNSTAGPILPPASLGASAKKRTTPLLLKGRIFLSNVTKAAAQVDRAESRYGLEVWWRGDEDLEFFTLRCRTEEQMKMWETNINGLVYLEQEKQRAEKTLRQQQRDRDREAGSVSGGQGRSSSSASLASRPSMSSLHAHAQYDASGRRSAPYGQQSQSAVPPMPYLGQGQSRPHYSQQPSSSSASLSNSAQAHQSMPSGPHTRGPSVSSVSLNNGAGGGGVTPGRSKDLTKYFGASQIPTIAPPSSAANARFGGSPGRPSLGNGISSSSYGVTSSGIYDDDDDDFDDDDEPEYSPTRERERDEQAQAQAGYPRRSTPNGNGQGYPRSASALGGRITPGAGPSDSRQYQQQQYPQQYQPQQPQQQQQRPPLRSQFSSVRLDSAYAEQEEDAHAIALARARERAATTPGSRHTPSPSLASQNANANNQYQQRIRATSTPAHQYSSSSSSNAPPLPQGYGHPQGGQGQIPPMRYASSATTTSTNTQTTHEGYYGWSAATSESSLASSAATTDDMSSVTTMEEKRGSGSSQFSGASHGGSGSSGYDHEHNGGASSPLTPYGSSDSNVSGSILHRVGKDGGVPSAMSPLHQQHYGHTKNNQSMSSLHTQHMVMQGGVAVAGLPPMKIKVHYRQDLFIIAVSRTVTYDDLADKVGKKIRLCGGDRPEDAPLKIKYRDDDGDLISLGSDEDVQMAFDTELPLIALWVQ